MKPQVGWDEGFDEASRRAAASTLEVARRRGLVDIGYTTVDTPVGTLFVASTGRGLVRLAFPDEPFDHVLEELADTLSPRLLEDPKRTDAARRQLEAYFEGRVHRFRTAVDWSLTPPGFSRRVLEATAAIPIVVPCHRVVPSGGGVGKYGGQEWRKEFLLDLEGALAGP